MAQEQQDSLNCLHPLTVINSSDGTWSMHPTQGLHRLMYWQFQPLMSRGVGLLCLDENVGGMHIL
jgi:hypothetical protein